jgi:Uma2 family endonuclease
MMILDLCGPILPNAELHSISDAEQIMSMPAIRRHRWTTAEVDRLVEEREGYNPRYELVDGELLVTPAPSGRHQRIVLHLAFLLRSYISGEKLGEVRLGPGEINLASGTRFEPDLFVAPSLDGLLPEAALVVSHPLLVCEVLSPGSSRHDRITKRRSFQQHSVPEYWIVDGDAEAFEIWHPGDERAALVDGRFSWWPVGASQAFELDVQQFFRDVADHAPLPR